VTRPIDVPAPAGLFVVGTDTAVGKTTVAVGLARLARRGGHVPIPYKPVETGCAPSPVDAHRLWDAAQPPISRDAVCPFPLPLPAAPAAAATASGIRLDLDDLVRKGLDLATHGDFLIVEGAGGLMVPLDGAQTNVDLASRLGLPLLVVGRTALGTINHVALTLAEIARRHLKLAGVLLVQTTWPAGPHELFNTSLIEEVTGVRPLGTLPYLPALAETKSPDPDKLADALAWSVSPEALRQLFDQTN
jgi:dethiobiotin synthetase